MNKTKVNLKNTAAQIHKLTEGLLHAKQYEEAINLLGGIDIESVSPEQKAYHNLLLVEANLFICNYEVGDILGEVVTFYKESIENAKFARAKYLHGWLLTFLGDYSEAKEVLLESYVHYKRCNSVRGQARALNRLSFIAFVIGDIDSSIEYLEKLFIYM